MYTEEHLESLGKQLRGRTLLWLVPEAVLLLAVVLSWRLRSEWVTGALTSALFAVVLFSMTASILPVRRYRDFVRQALHGKTTRDEAAFLSVGEEAEEHEGIRVYPVLMRADVVKQELSERRFFWDANLPLPDWRPGERLALRSWERIIVWWDEAGASGMTLR